MVQSGTRIAEIAPKGSRFILKAEMPTDQKSISPRRYAGKSQVRCLSFSGLRHYRRQDHQEIHQRRSRRITATGKINVFELEIQLDRSCIQKGNQCIPLNPGDTATAEAIVRQRRVIDYILNPLRICKKTG
ncbi:MAG UNVERIFIED_CONTAM: hypothetical protein LVR29_17210 [Microcystis novacekii LVE1205-3]